MQEIIAAPAAFERCQIDARQVYDTHFSETVVDTALKAVLTRLELLPASP